MSKKSKKQEEREMVTYVVECVVDCDGLEKMNWAIDMINLVLRIVGTPLSTCLS